MKSDLDVKCIDEPLRDVLIGIWFRRFENNLFSRASWRTLMVDGIKNLKYPDLPIPLFLLGHLSGFISTTFNAFPFVDG